MKNIEKYKDEILKYAGYQHSLMCLIYENIMKKNDCAGCCSKCKRETIKWLTSEYKEPILTEEGKAYLSNLLKPYGLGTCAFQFNLSEVVKNDTYKLTIADEYGIIINLAIRQDSEMQELFKKMQFNKVYSVKELGL